MSGRRLSNPVLYSRYSLGRECPSPSLMYTQPISTEVMLLSCQAKDDLAHAIMTAIRKHLGRQQHSALEKAIRQLVS